MKIFAAITIVLGLALGHTGCSCMGGKVERPYAAPSVQTVLDHLATARAGVTSFQVESVMDYWVGSDRVKGTVLLMGRVGAYMRINALNPTGDNVAADLACTGMDFQFIDYNNNCQIAGPCNRASVAQLLRVSLEPDEFLLLVAGTTPVIANPQGTVSWDASKGREIVQLTSGDGTMTQTIILDGREQRWDVLSSVVRDAAGKELWNLQNKDFKVVTGADGQEYRMPAKTRFKQPQNKADLLVRWVERTVNPTLDDSRFQMSIPPGLPSC